VALAGLGFFIEVHPGGRPRRRPRFVGYYHLRGERYYGIEDTQSDTDCGRDVGYTIGRKSPHRDSEKDVKDKKNIGISSCFVVMPFGGVWDDYYENVYAPAVTEAGLSPLRGDEIFRAGSILQDIVDCLISADLVLADISNENRNVHYEVGLAHALGKPTIFVAPTGMPLFFDIGQERMIFYDKDNAFWGDELRKDVTRTIVETLERPETAVPTAFMHIKPTRYEADEITIRLRRIEEHLGEISRSAIGSMREQTGRMKSLLKGLPEAEEEAMRLLETHGSDGATRRLLNMGYGQAMAEAAVAKAVARMGRP